MLKDLILNCRSYRRFFENETIDENLLLEILDIARFSSAAGNKQTLRYKLITDNDGRKKIFNELKWASYLTDWEGPAEGEKPAAYMIVMQDKTIDLKSEFVHVDLGIASQNIMLLLAEKGMGGCMIASMNRDNIRREFGINDSLEILLTIAVGRPMEKILIEDIGPDGSIKYYRDKNRTHHVPKRKTKDIIIQ